MITYEEALKYVSSARYIYVDPTPEEIALSQDPNRWFAEVGAFELFGTNRPVVGLEHKELKPAQEAVEVGTAVEEAVAAVAAEDLE
jgi:hypothetical protein